MKMLCFRNRKKAIITLLGALSLLAILNSLKRTSPVSLGRILAWTGDVTVKSQYDLVKYNWINPTMERDDRGPREGQRNMSTAATKASYGYVLVKDRAMERMSVSDSFSPLRNAISAMRTLGYRVNERETDSQFIWVRKPSGSVYSDVKKLTRTLNPVYNHLPGMRPLIFKKELLTDTNSTVILKAFAMPYDKKAFSSYTSQRPNRLWISKGFKHRGVNISSTDNILKQTKHAIVQEYLTNPLLVDNRKFDIGVFLMVTSVAPMRAYVYMEDFLLKFCTTGYLPFDPKVTNKYVESHPITRLWELSAMKNVTFTGRRFRDILAEYLDGHGYSSRKLLDNIILSTVDILSYRESLIANEAKDSLRKDRFMRSFDLLRMDMVADDAHKVWVMEINLSPDTETSSPISLHIPLFQKVLASGMVMGGARNYSWSSVQADEMLNQSTVREKDIFVDDGRCTSCSENICSQRWQCRTCKICLNVEDIYHIKTAVLENRRQPQGPWVRVFPPPFRSPEEAREWKPELDKYYRVLSPNSKMMALWYHQKCIQDIIWCW